MSRMIPALRPGRSSLSSAPDLPLAACRSAPRWNGTEQRMLPKRKPRKESPKTSRFVGRVLRVNTNIGPVYFKAVSRVFCRLFNCIAAGSEMIADPEPLWNSPEQLHHHIRYELGQSIDKMLKTSTLGNEGVVVKRWKEEHHRYYNLKEMERQKRMVLTRYVQDHDLLLDVENSDLLPITSNGNGSSRHQRLSTATH